MKTWLIDLIEEELTCLDFKNETHDDFIIRICAQVLEELERDKRYAPHGLGEHVIEEIEHAVDEYVKIKTYGFYNLAEYRQHVFRKRMGVNA